MVLDKGSHQVLCLKKYKPKALQPPCKTVNTLLILYWLKLSNFDQFQNTNYDKVAEIYADFIKLFSTIAK